MRIYPRSVNVEKIKLPVAMIAPLIKKGETENTTLIK